MGIFSKLGPNFIIGKDFNVKGTVWCSILVTPGKENELLNAINETKCEFNF